MIADQRNRSIAEPAIVFGLTLFVIGLTFAMPAQLVPDSARKAVSEHMSPEVANAYACVAWAGWAHFLFAFDGQGRALLRAVDPDRIKRTMTFLGLIALSAFLLFLVRGAVGAALFGAVVWVYFIDHFLKAEEFFEGRKRDPKQMFARWIDSLQTLVAFTWLSVVLFDVNRIGSHRWLLWWISFGIGALVLAWGGWRKLAAGDTRGPLLALLFVAEALVWGVIGRYGGQTFLFGVYVLHIAAGSYFHYFGGYFAAASKLSSADKWKFWAKVVGVNLGVIGCGFMASQVNGAPNFVLGIESFTLWVGLHLVVSDLFPYLKSWFIKPVQTAT